MPRVLITGSGGFIGNWLADRAVARGTEVIATYRHQRPTGQTAEAAHLVQRDLAEGLPDIAPVDLIVHAAANTHLNPNLNVQDYIRSNVEATARIIDFARSCPTPPIIIYLSTLTVYGDITVTKLEEHTPCVNPNVYGQTKRLAECLLADAPELPVVIFRLPGVVGPEYFKPWLGKVLQSFLAQQPVEMYNPTAPFNNVTDLDEIDRLIVHLVKQGIKLGTNVVNLASTQPVTVAQAVQLLKRSVGSSSPIRRCEGSERSFQISTDRLRECYGYVPASTAEVIRRYAEANYANFSDHPVPHSERTVSDQIPV